MPLTLAHVVYDDIDDPSADTAITTHHFETAAQGSTAAERLLFANRFLTFWDAIGDLVTAEVVLDQIRFYDVPAVSGIPAGEPEEIREYNAAGRSAQSRLPPQVACSVTEETSIRKRWGRFYIPGLTPAIMGNGGRFATPAITTIANAAEVMYDGWRTDGIPARVRSRFGLPALPVRAIRVDNVPDIIRRRRLSVTTVRLIRDVEA